MKHIKKKFISEKDDEKEMEFLVDLADKELHKKAKNKNFFIQTTNDTVIKAFIFRNGKSNIIIPIPDLTLAYLDMAYYLNKQLRKKFQEDIYEKMDASKNSDRIDEIALNEIYHFYGSASSCVIMLYTSLESFVNYILPDDKEYVKKLNHKTEHYNKEQIQKTINFYEKIKEVLPSFHGGKNYFKRETSKTTHIQNLKELRDEIIHTKSHVDFKSQEAIIKKLLKFNYEETFDAVRSFMNFYIENYVEECSCGNDY